MQKGRRLCKALLDQSLKQRPETTQGKHKRNRNVHGKAKQGGQHRQGTLGHHVTEPGAKRKPTEKQKKKISGHSGAGGTRTRSSSPCAARAQRSRGSRGQFLASVLGPYLCLALTCASCRPCSPPRLSPSGHEGRGVGRRREKR